MIRALLLLVFLSLQYTIPYRTGKTAVAPATPTWVYVDTGGNGSCAAGTTCTITGLTATTANSVWVVAAEFATASGPSIASASGGGGTWTLCASFGCYLTTAGVGTIDQAYNVTGAGGATSMTVTLNSSYGTSWAALASEWKCTANCGTTALDVLGSNTQTASCTSCTGASFTGMTAGDLCVQLISDGTGTGSPSSPYVWDSIDTWAYSLSAPNGTAPTWTQTSGAFQASGMCFK